jgi:hypothetical protein
VRRKQTAVIRDSENAAVRSENERRKAQGVTLEGMEEGARARGTVGALRLSGPPGQREDVVAKKGETTLLHDAIVAA